MAVVAVILGGLAFVGFGPITGIPAIAVGVIARQRIDRSRGTTGGSTLASFAIAIGIISTVFTFLIAGGIAVALWLKHVVEKPSATPPDVGSEVAMSPHRDHPHSHEWLRADPDAPPLAVVDLPPSREGLQTLLRQQDAAAKRSHQVLLVQTTVKSGCTPCDEIAEAVEDPRAVEAMAGIRLVRLDAAAFAKELPRLGMDRSSVPWFFIIDAATKAKDAINANEWDDNVPENIAPVLVDFAQGKLHERRLPAGTDL